MTKKQQEFINLCDQEITEDIWTSFMIPEEDLTFKVFSELYQARHIKKYGCRLKVKNRFTKLKESAYFPLILIPLGGIYFALLELIMTIASK